ncbi:conserved Plasmodium protein, unknown function [Plasmodium vinckei vinckei]|uniref:Uncharacterized protein n=1 Tax=Plasmodium vinckei vinckei TaxID=54757 RepID=A0A449BYI2_PLAVN|nr:conserved Plasmodium protein, unknown function [Plasmodium vinckei vinckei]VEV58422.1 conserved Plasmodium protein, unknown function [Plasmodium vinckei vinckei]
MDYKEKQNNNGNPQSEFDLGRLLNKFDMSNYNEDFVITNNILKYHIKNINMYNYEANKIYDKSELDLYKDKLINKCNIHYYPYELYFNTYRNIYREEKMLLNLPNNMKKTKEKENEEKDDNEEKEKEKDKEDYVSNMFEEEQGVEDDYNYDYYKSEDDLENEDHDENVI